MALRKSTMKDNERPLYQPPRARDLSAPTAHGQGPLGMCVDGSSLTSESCSDGGTPEGGECSPNGLSPEYGYCTLGDFAVEGCSSGGIHT